MPTENDNRNLELAKKFATEAIQKFARERVAFEDSQLEKEVCGILDGTFKFSYKQRRAHEATWGVKVPRQNERALLRATVYRSLLEKGVSRKEAEELAMKSGIMLRKRRAGRIKGKLLYSKSERAKQTLDLSDATPKECMALADVLSDLSMTSLSGFEFRAGFADVILPRKMREIPEFRLDGKGPLKIRLEDFYGNTLQNVYSPGQISLRPKKDGDAKGIGLLYLPNKNGGRSYFGKGRMHYDAPSRAERLLTTSLKSIGLQSFAKRLFPRTEELTTRPWANTHRYRPKIFQTGAELVEYTTAADTGTNGKLPPEHRLLLNLGNVKRPEYVKLALSALHTAPPLNKIEIVFWPTGSHLSRQKSGELKELVKAAALEIKNLPASPTIVLQVPESVKLESQDKWLEEIPSTTEVLLKERYQDLPPNITHAIYDPDAYSEPVRMTYKKIDGVDEEKPVFQSASVNTHAIVRDDPSPSELNNYAEELQKAIATMQSQSNGSTKVLDLSNANPRVMHGVPYLSGIDQIRLSLLVTKIVMPMGMSGETVPRHITKFFPNLKELCITPPEKGDTGFFYWQPKQNEDGPKITLEARVDSEAKGKEKPRVALKTNSIIVPNNDDLQALGIKAPNLIYAYPDAKQTPTINARSMSPRILPPIAIHATDLANKKADQTILKAMDTLDTNGEAVSYLLARFVFLVAANSSLVIPDPTYQMLKPVTLGGVTYTPLVSVNWEDNKTALENFWKFLQPNIGTDPKALAADVVDKICSTPANVHESLAQLKNLASNVRSALGREDTSATTLLNDVELEAASNSTMDPVKKAFKQYGIAREQYLNECTLDTLKQAAQTKEQRDKLVGVFSGLFRTAAFGPLQAIEKLAIAPGGVLHNIFTGKKESLYGSIGNVVGTATGIFDCIVGGIQVDQAIRQKYQIGKAKRTLKADGLNDNCILQTIGSQLDRQNYRANVNLGLGISRVIFGGPKLASGILLLTPLSPLGVPISYGTDIFSSLFHYIPSRVFNAKFAQKDAELADADRLSLQQFLQDTVNSFYKNELTSPPSDDRTSIQVQERVEKYMLDSLMTRFSNQTNIDSTVQKSLQALCLYLALRHGKIDDKMFDHSAFRNLRTNLGGDDRISAYSLPQLFDAVHKLVVEADPRTVYTLLGSKPRDENPRTVYTLLGSEPIHATPQNTQITHAF